MGRSIRARLEGHGHSVIGVDLSDAEVEVDLSTRTGRDQMVAALGRMCGGSLDGLVVAAGTNAGEAQGILAVNYFGAVATLVGLRPLLAKGVELAAAGGLSGAVVVSSNSTTTQPSYPSEIADLCLSGDEDLACQKIGTDALGAYPASKLALAKWVRRRATQGEWIGSGIRLNAIAPGFIDTPMTQGTWDFVSKLGDIFPIPVGRPGKDSEVAGLVEYLLSPDAAFFCGSFITMDGGTDAAVRADDWPGPRGT